jgi:hypothetical protein
MVCTLETTCPQASAAVQVRRIVPDPLQPDGRTSSSYVTTASEHASVAVARPVAAGSVDWPHSTTMSAGKLRCGAKLSRMTRVWTAVALLPQESVATHVRAIVPVPQPVRAAWSEYETVGDEHASVAVAWPVAAGRTECPHSIAASPGARSTGAVVSATVIVCRADVLLPQASVAVQVRVIVPVPPQLPRLSTSA